MSEPKSGASGRGALAELKEAVTHLFEQVVGIVPDIGLKPEFPRNEIRIEDDRFRVLVELPGMNRDDVEVSVTGRALRVSGHRPKLEPPEGGRLLRNERPSGDFDLNLRLPGEIDTLGVVARMSDGVLEIRLPRLTETRGRSVEVEADEPSREETRYDEGPAGPTG